jgi:methyltransferase (TIGR00027 family)
VRNPDWLAAKLVGPDEIELLGDSAIRHVWGQPFELVAQNPEAMGSARAMIVRTRFIDSRLEAAIHEGATQFVVLGAGFDTRAYRFKDLLQNVRVFEVDQACTQVTKKRRVSEIVGSAPDNLAYVTLDFTTDDLNAALTAAGYITNQRTFFNWEGTTMYLPAETVHKTLRWIASNSGTGSTVVFDYTFESVIRSLEKIKNFAIPEHSRKALAHFNDLISNEPWIFGIPNTGEKRFLEGLGLALRKVLGITSAEAVDAYLTRADGTIFVPTPPGDHHWYMMLEASVPDRH